MSLFRVNLRITFKFLVKKIIVKRFIFEFSRIKTKNFLGRRVPKWHTVLHDRWHRCDEEQLCPDQRQQGWKLRRVFISTRTARRNAPEMWSWSVRSGYETWIWFCLWIFFASVKSCQERADDWFLQKLSKYHPKKDEYLEISKEDFLIEFKCKIKN